MRAVLLGTSSSVPIPCPGCRCAQCAEARALGLGRSRSGLYLEAGGGGWVVDTSADLLSQLEREGLDPRVEGAVVTHTHGDHVLGLDDLVRVRGGEAPLEVRAAPYHRERIAAIFPGLLAPPAPRIRFEAWQAGSAFRFGPFRLEGFETGHRDTFPTTGVILEVEVGGSLRRIAYATDMGPLPRASQERLRGFDLLVADGSWPGTEGHGHPGSAEVVAWATAMGVGRLVFTHVGHVGAADAELRSRYGHGAGVARDGDDLLALLP